MKIFKVKLHRKKPCPEQHWKSMKCEWQAQGSFPFLWLLTCWNETRQGAILLHAASLFLSLSLQVYLPHHSTVKLRYDTTLKNSTPKIAFIFLKTSHYCFTHNDVIPCHKFGYIQLLPTHTWNVVFMRQNWAQNKEMFYFLNVCINDKLSHFFILRQKVIVLTF